jgi:hypothetical protein
VTTGEIGRPRFCLQAIVLVGSVVGVLRGVRTGGTRDRARTLVLSKDYCTTYSAKNSTVKWRIIAGEI